MPISYFCIVQLYFAEDLSTDTITLDKEESHHVVNVMRLHTGTTIDLTDGKGMFANGVISSSNPKACVIVVMNRNQQVFPRKYKLHIAIAPTKNIDRLEWFLEKATEIGIDAITPIKCNRSERKIINEDRLRKLITSAAKQSMNAWFPQLNSLVTFPEFIDQKAGEMKLIAHCGDGDKQLVNAVYQKGKDVLIMIGPEGDFDDEEIKMALNTGFNPVSLGASRLRTETAGLVACHSIAFMNQ